MKWTASKRKPRKDGMYYVRRVVKYDTANYREHIAPFYSIDTFSYTKEGGWGSYYWYNGALIGGAKPGTDDFEWAEVEYVE